MTTRQQVVAYVHDHPGVTTTQVCAGLGVRNSHAINNHLTRALEDGSLARSGRRGWYTWRPASAAQTLPVIAVLQARIMEIDSTIRTLERERTSLLAALVATSGGRS